MFLDVKEEDAYIIFINYKIFLKKIIDTLFTRFQLLFNKVVNNSPKKIHLDKGTLYILGCKTMKGTNISSIETPPC